MLAVSGLGYACGEDVAGRGTTADVILPRAAIG
jgi:hypothetical protein